MEPQFKQRMIGHQGVASVLIIVLVAPVYEEILFKYVIQHCVFRNTVGWIQILVTGILFGVSHGTTFHMVFGVIFGIITSFVFVVEQDLVISILIHIFYNTMVTCSRDNPSKWFTWNQGSGISL